MTDSTKTPLIVGFVADLMFTTRIEKVAQHLGFRLIWVEEAAQIGRFEASGPEPPGEALFGQKGALFTKITEWQPALLLFDLANQAIPWEKWIPLLKSSPATRRIPIMCFGPHTDVAVMTRAKQVGADVVLARSRFTADMPALFSQWAHIPDHDALAATCQEPLSEQAIQGLELFNKGEYYACHEELEDAWNADQGPGRELYRGLLQVGVAYLQIERGNYRGAVKMLLRVRQWLDPLPATCRGIDLADLRQNVQSVQETLLALGPAGIDQFDQTLLQKVKYHHR